MGSRLLDLVAKPLKTPEGQRFSLGREGDLETDFPVAGNFECCGLEFLVIEPNAQTGHRVGVADFERLRDKHCGGGSGAERHHGNLWGGSVLNALSPQTPRQRRFRFQLVFSDACVQLPVVFLMLIAARSAAAL